MLHVEFRVRYAGGADLFKLEPIRIEMLPLSDELEGLYKTRNY